MDTLNPIESILELVVVSVTFDRLETAADLILVLVVLSCGQLRSSRFISFVIKS